MNRVMAVVEGQTERAFLRDVAAPWLGSRSGIVLEAALVGKPGHKGGNSFEVAKRDVLNFLSQRSLAAVTTFFDYYGLKQGWPGRDEARERPHHERPHVIEHAMKAAIESQVKAKHVWKFIPYIQMHEFEALLFSEPSTLAGSMLKPSAAAQLQEIRGQFSNPEEINDSAATAPSKRIKRIFPSYQKVSDGPTAAGKITMEKIMAECPHFCEWIKQLQSLA